MLNPLIPRLRRSAWMASFLDAVNVAAVALMLAVVIRLGAETLTTWPPQLIAALAITGVFAFRLSSIRLVAMGAVLGGLLEWLI